MARRITLLQHFLTSYDYGQIIKMQANQTAPFHKAVNINNLSKGYDVKTKVKTKKILHRK